jgi:rhodanese-related sulfurtransferase
VSLGLIVGILLAVAAAVALIRWLAGGGYETVAPDRAAELLKEKDLVLLDVRTKGEYRLGRIPGALLIPVSELERKMDQIPLDRRLLVYCASGFRSRLVARRLAGLSKGKVFNLAGGLDAWQRAGLPVEK